MRNTLRIMTNALSGSPADARPIAFATVFLVAHHLDRLGDVVLAPLGLTTKQWLLLAVLARGFEGRAPSLSEAAALYGSSRQNVKAIARSLAARGYLRLAPDPGDRRVLRLLVTPKTSVFAGPGWAAREEAFFAFAFGSLDPAGVEALAGLLQRWLAAIAPAPAPVARPANVRQPPRRDGPPGSPPPADLGTVPPAAREEIP